MRLVVFRLHGLSESAGSILSTQILSFWKIQIKQSLQPGLEIVAILCVSHLFTRFY